MERRQHRTPIGKKYDLPELGELVKRETWMEKAACKGMDTNIFFPDKGDNTEDAKAICKPCEVREECLEYGIRTTGNRNGIYGGMSGIQRRVYARNKNITIWKSA